MDPIKVVLFVAAFLLLIVLGRKFSGKGDDYIPRPYTPPSPTPEVVPIRAALPKEKSTPRAPATIGADLPFPINLPPVVTDGDGRYNRPYFLNYYFERIDIGTGPIDKRSFCDDFIVETQDPNDGVQWMYRFTVATPSGLQKFLNEEKIASLHLENETVIVNSWDLEIILGTVVREIMKLYQQPDQEEQ